MGVIIDFLGAYLDKRSQSQKRVGLWGYIGILISIGFLILNNWGD